MSSGDLITIYPKPTFTSRFPLRWHPNTNAIVSEAQTEFLARWPWALESDKELYPKRDLDSWFLAVCPEGPDDRVLIGVRWSTWLFLCDDLIENESSEDAKRRFISIKKILSRDPDREVVSPVDIMLEELCNAVTSVEDVDLQKRGYMFLSATIDFFHACASKEDRKTALNSGFEGYIKLRFTEAAGGLTMNILSWARGITPLFETTTNPKLYRLMEISVVHAILINDLFSYRIEIRNFQSLEEAKMRANAGDDSEHAFTVFSWMAVLIQSQGMSYEEACEEIGRMISAEEEEYVALLEELRTEYTNAGDDVGLAGLEQLAQVLIDLMAGNAAWSVLCGRYNYGFIE